MRTHPNTSLGARKLPRCAAKCLAVRAGDKSHEYENLVQVRDGQPTARSDSTEPHDTVHERKERASQRMPKHPAPVGGPRRHQRKGGGVAHNTRAPEGGGGHGVTCTPSEQACNSVQYQNCQAPPAGGPCRARGKVCDTRVECTSSEQACQTKRDVNPCWDSIRCAAWPHWRGAQCEAVR